MNAKVKRCLQVASQPSCASTALLFLRLVMGSAFLIHGYGKIQNPFGWMGPEAPVPSILQALAALAEFGGGLGLILGLLTPLCAIGIACTMAVAVITHMFVMKDPFVNATGGGAYELALVYFGLSILFLMVGPGKYSADAKVFGTRT